MAPSRLRLLSCYLFLSSSFLGGMQSDIYFSGMGSKKKITRNDNQRATTQKKHKFDVFEQCELLDKICGNSPLIKATSYLLDPTRQKISEKLIEEILLNCPEELAEIIESYEYISNEGTQTDNLDRKLLLIGPPGCGKTTLGKIIALKSKKPCQYVFCPGLGNSFKDSGKESIHQIFAPFLGSNKPCVILFDELTALTDRHENKNNPETGIVQGFWGFLEECMNNPNVIIVATVNDATDIPEPLLSRFRGGIFKLQKPKNPRRTLEFYLLPQRNLNSFQMFWFARKITHLSPREIETLAKKANFYAEQRKRKSDCSDIEITSSNLYRALKKLESENSLIKKSIFKRLSSHIPWMIQNTLQIGSSLYFHRQGMAIQQLLHDKSSGQTQKIHEDQMEYSKGSLDHAQKAHKEQIDESFKSRLTSVITSIAAPLIVEGIKYVIESKTGTKIDTSSATS